MRQTSNTVRFFTVRKLIEELEKCDPAYAIVLAPSSASEPLMVSNDHDLHVVIVVPKTDM